jgi:hypothetical protein
MKEVDIVHTKFYVLSYSCFRFARGVLLFASAISIPCLISFPTQGILPVLIKIQHVSDIKSRLESIVEEGDYAKVSC